MFILLSVTTLNLIMSSINCLIGFSTLSKAEIKRDMKDIDTYGSHLVTVTIITVLFHTYIDALLMVII
jgi:hypothetical protein